MGVNLRTRVGSEVDSLVRHWKSAFLKFFVVLLESAGGCSAALWRLSSGAPFKPTYPRTTGATCSLANVYDSHWREVRSGDQGRAFPEPAGFWGDSPEGYPVGWASIGSPG